MISTSLHRVSVFNVAVDLSANYNEWLWQQLQNRKGSHIITLNAEMSMLAQKNEEFAQTLQSADLVIPDGAGVIFYLRLFGYQQDRCPGIELAESLIQRAGRENLSAPIYFYGGAEGVAQKAVAQWQSQFPQLSFSARHGYLSPAEELAFLQQLQQEQPQLIFVGLGVPRQEFWIQTHRHLCPNAIWMGIGGSFDIWSGSKIRAPRWFRQYHLEWLYRLYQEPYRWKRMLALPQFAWASLRHRLKRGQSVSNSG